MVDFKSIQQVAFIVRCKVDNGRQIKKITHLLWKPMKTRKIKHKIEKSILIGVSGEVYNIKVTTPANNIGKHWVNKKNVYAVGIFENQAYCKVPDKLENGLQFWDLLYIV